MVRQVISVHSCGPLPCIPCLVHADAAICSPIIAHYACMLEKLDLRECPRLLGYELTRAMVGGARVSDNEKTNLMADPENNIQACGDGTLNASNTRSSVMEFS